MNMSNPFLALIGHGTTGKDKTGKDDIQRGIHLRWAFRREMGFPLGCFRLYRRPNGKYGNPICLGVQKLDEQETPLKLPECAYRVTVDATFTGRGSLTVVAYAEGMEVGRSSVQVRSAANRTVTVHATAIDSVKLYGRSVASVRVYYVPCEYFVNQDAGGWEELGGPICLPISLKDPYGDPERERINVVDRLPEDPGIRERYGGEEAEELVSALRTLVDPTGITPQADRLIEAETLPDDCPPYCPPPGQETPTIRFPALDAVLMAAIDPIVARAVGLYYLDQTAEEGTSYDYKIEGYWPPATLWQLSNSLTFEDYPPKFRFSLNLFTKDSLVFRSAIRPTIIERPSTSAGTNQALAFLSTDAFDWNFPRIDSFPIDCPESGVEIRFPEPVGEAQIYLGQETPNVVLEAWDDERNRRVDVLSGKVKSLGQIAGGRMRVQVLFKTLNDVPQMDRVPPDLLAGKLLVQLDWLGNPKTYRILSSSAGSSVGSAQEISILLKVPALQFPARGNCTIEPSPSTRCEDVLAVHGYQSTDQITRIVLRGERFWLYKICWQAERIPHGTHCAFVYDLRIQDADPLARPSGIQAVVLPGLVKKELDGQPLMEGSTSDARCSVGLYWDLPLTNYRLLPKSALRYHIRRRLEENDSTELLTGENPVMVTQADPEIQAAWLQNLPTGYPQEPPFYIDADLKPHSYRYAVAGVDLFGRISEFSDPSNPVEPQPPPPPPPANVSAYFIDRRDHWLSDKDLAALPDGVDEAICLRWRWPQEYHRMSPDVQDFRVYYLPGVPNVLLGEITAAGNESGGRMEVTAEITGLEAAPENLLAGRMLSQGGKAFRILAHRQGTRINSGHKIKCSLRLPPEPSQNRPVAGVCAIALNATIPVQVMMLVATHDRLTVTLKTDALGAIPPSGLRDGTLVAAGIEALVTGDSPKEITPDYVVVDVQLPPFDPREARRFSDIQVPFFARLKLPAPGNNLLKNYSVSDAWPADFDAIRRNDVGNHDLVIRKAADGEPTGLTQTGSRTYVLVVDQLPPGLDVSTRHPIREGHFGMSCEGPGGKGPVSEPARIVRVYRGAIGDQAALQTLDQVPATVENLYADPPNFEGKSKYTFTWIKQSDWRYEVYRALEDTLFKTDAEVRSEKNQDGTLKRSRDPADYAQWIAFFDAQYHENIKSLIIESAVVNRQSIEDQPDRNVLLQALASLPFNDRAFTRLDLDDKHLWQDANNMHCVDDTLDGRAEGRYFYRVQAFDSAGNPSPMGMSTDSAGNPSPMGMSTPPVYVRGDQRPAAPVITRVEGGDRQIVIYWSAMRDSNIKGYLVYRTDDQAKIGDWRRMDLLPNPSVGYSFKVLDMPPEPSPAEHSYLDEPVKPQVPYYYGLVAIRQEESGTRYMSELSAIRVGQAVDMRIPEPPVPEVVWESSDSGALSAQITWSSADETLLQRRARDLGQWRSLTEWLTPGAHIYHDYATDPTKSYDYRLWARRDTMSAAMIGNSAQLHSVQ